MPATAHLVADYLNLLGIPDTLPDAARLVTKSELVAAVRDATVTLEAIVRSKSQFSTRGADLMDQAFSFEYDRATKRVTRPPPIRLNNLRTETKRNEQNGLRLIAMGLMRGARNTFAHSDGTRKFYHCLNIITVTEWIIRQIEGTIGTVAESRTMFRPVIPRAHRGHEFDDPGFSPTVVGVHCKTCDVEFTTRWRPLISTRAV